MCLNLKCQRAGSNDINFKCKQLNAMLGIYLKWLKGQIWQNNKSFIILFGQLVYHDCPIVGARGHQVAVQLFNRAHAIDVVLLILSIHNVNAVLFLILYYFNQAKAVIPASLNSKLAYCYYQLLVDHATTIYRFAVNVRKRVSKLKSLIPFKFLPEYQFLVAANGVEPLTEGVV